MSVLGSSFYVSDDKFSDFHQGIYLQALCLFVQNDLLMNSNFRCLKR